VLHAASRSAPRTCESGNHLSRRSVAAPLKQPTRVRDGPPHRTPMRSCSRWGLPSRRVSAPLVRSYRTVASLPVNEADKWPQTIGGLHVCGTFLGIAPTGGYPAPCPAELGLSSRAAFRRCAGAGFIRKSLRSPHSPDRLHPLAHLRSRGAALGGEWGSLGLDSLP
jgi:hypothetical protein